MAEYVAPDWFTKTIANPIVRALGFATTLTVRGRATGEPRSVPVNEVADAAKPPIIDVYVQRWGRQVRAQFAQLPDPHDHPVFRVEPAS